MEFITNNLQKYGRANEATPAKWNAEYKDYNAPLDSGSSAPPVKRAPSVAVKSELAKPAIVKPEVEPDIEVIENGEAKKRKRHDGETEEERAERKRKKKEKKEKKEERKLKREAKSIKSEDDVKAVKGDPEEESD